MTLLFHPVWGTREVDIDHETEKEFVSKNYDCGASWCDSDTHYFHKLEWRHANEDEIRSYLISKFDKNAETDSVVTPRDAAVRALVELLDFDEPGVVLQAADMLLRL